MPATHRLRRRFTLLYGVMSVLSGMTLLAIVIVLAQGLPPADTAPPAGAETVQPGAAVIAPAAYLEFRADVLLVSGIALAVMAPVSLALGWMFAGRMLRPVQAMTIRLRQISSSNVHERLAAAGRRDEFKDLADTIDGLLARLESALDGHKRFVANAAHELRTPLTVEHALIEESLTDPDATVEAFRANFERLLVANRQRGQLLESLLTLANSEHGRDHVDEVDLSGIVRQAIRDRTADIDRHRLRVKATARPARLIGDPTLIARLVANLCDNAIHYNTPGGVIDISTRLEGGKAVLVIANTGPVVPIDEVQRLFEPFQRLHRVSDNAHHGLGLSIVRAIVAAHAAELNAYAQPRGGLLVQIAFPTGEANTKSTG